MTDIATGSLVKHVSLGVGKVVAVEATALHVFFPQSDKLQAAKLRWPAAKPFLTQQGIDSDAWLDGLNSFALDAKSGRYTLSANFVTHDQAVSEFLERFPQAFRDPAYVGDGNGKRERAWRWRAATSEWSKTLGGGQGEHLLADGQLDEVIRRARRVATHVTGIPGTIDAEALYEALEPGDEVAAFFEALFAALAMPAAVRGRVEKLFGASDALGVERGLAWAMATLFPFIAEPTRHVLLLPKSTCSAAARLGCDLRYKPAPNWATYNALRGFSEQLLEKLRPHGASDFIDVEAFLYALGTPSPRRKR